MRMNKFFVFSFIFLFFSVSVFSEEWIIASQKFEINQSKNLILDSLCDFFPSAILENLGSSLNREISPNEKFLRKEYESQTERLSLFLQLSSEYKKRDSLILQNYSQKVLNKKIKEENQKIEEIEKKLNENLQKLDELKLETEKIMQNSDSEENLSEEKKWIYLFKNFFTNEQNLSETEKISFYKNDITKFFEPSENAKKNGITSYDFKKEINSAKINTLITGKISVYGDFLSVTVDAYLFPSAQKITSVMEVGRINDSEFIASSIARKLIPFITNAFPVELDLQVSTNKEFDFYLDDVLQKEVDEKIIIDSGIHTIQIICDGFSPASTTFRFEGNRRYKIEVNLEPIENSFLYLMQKNPSDLAVFSNGERISSENNQYSKIKINGKSVLGMFVSPDNFSSFFYIPQEIAISNSVAKINPKIRKEKDYIDTRRKKMYGAYTLLMISLIPNFYCNGEFQNSYEILQLLQTQESYQTAKKWALSSDICTGISIGCGVLFAYELVRYLFAANSILPQKATKTQLDFNSLELDLSSSENENIQKSEEFSNSTETENIKIKNEDNGI